MIAVCSKITRRSIIPIASRVLMSLPSGCAALVRWMEMVDTERTIFFDHYSVT